MPVVVRHQDATGAGAVPATGSGHTPGFHYTVGVVGTHGPLLSLCKTLVHLELQVSLLEVQCVFALS